MALEFKTAKLPCATWRTKLPRVTCNYESQTFPRGDSQLQFRLECSFCDYKNYEYFILRLINVNENQPKVNVPVYVESSKEHRKACYIGTVTTSEYLRLSMKSLKTDYEISDDEISFIFIFDVEFERTVEKAGPTQSTPLKSGNTFVETLQIQSMCLQTFSRDIEKLFGDTNFSDALLKCGDKYFPVNKNILSARSKVFAAMFRNKLKESETGEVDIPNVEPNVMEQFLLYVYSGRAEALSLSTAFSLYQISDMYNVPSLKTKCASFLTDSLTEEIVCQVLLLAQKYENIELFDIAASFLTTKDEFIKSAAWKTFANDNPGIAVKVYMKFLEN